MKKILAIGLALLTFTAQAQTIEPDKNDPSFEVRARVLVQKMTLEEKISQMKEVSPAIERLGIPAYNWWNEILHGVARTKYKVTVFPQAIGMAAAFDREALRMMGDYSATEARAIYNDEVAKADNNLEARYKGLTFWTPNVNIFRDPRWGRGQETYGEDPYLTSELGAAIVHGLEGNHPKYLKVSACAKHYAVHSGPEPSRHYFNATANPIDLWNTYLPAFQRLIRDEKVSSVMCAYNRFEGKPCCGNDQLMMDILRNRWQFKGYTVSDCGAINNFWRTHKTSPDKAHAAAESVLNGTDLECGAEWHKLWTYNSLDEAVADGLINEEKIDESLIRLFTIRMRLGMFDDPAEVPFSDISVDTLNAKAHADHALRLARESMVLLKNNGILPLSGGKKIAVVGPNADNDKVMYGNYNGFPLQPVNVLKGMQAKAGDVIYTKGTDYLEALDTEAELARIKDADIVVFVGGISSKLEGEEGSVKGQFDGFYKGDRTTIQLPRVQTEFMQKVKDMGKQLIFVNMSGSAMAINWENEHADAILQAWYPGQAGGQAVAEILYGEVNPSGRLPLTFYRSDDDLPPIEDYSMVERTYRYFTGEPLYEFGYGLSYTSFKYSGLTVKENGGKYKVSVKVKNTGDRSGDEVVQLYICPDFTDARIAFRSLKEFTRISLEKGETRTVEFELDKTAFQQYDENGELYTIPGDYIVAVGGRQPARNLKKDAADITLKKVIVK